MLKKRLFGMLTLIVGFMLVLVFVGCDEELEQTPESFIVKNDTEDTISSVYLRQPGTSDWGIWVLTGGISIGESKSVTVPNNRMDSQFKTDIRLWGGDNIEYIKLSQTLTNKGTITFTSSDLASSSARTVTIVNNTEDTIYNVFFRQPQSGTSNWGTGFTLGSSIIKGESKSITIPNGLMDGQFKTDIRLWGGDNIQYIKLSQTINHHGTITFTSSDLDN